LNGNHGTERQRPQDRSPTVGPNSPAWGVLFVVCALAVTGCATVQKVFPPVAWQQARVRNEGYSLLYQLLSQESDVAKILIIKHADRPVTAVINEIASTCGQAQHALELFYNNDRHLSFAMSHLPAIEQQTRAAIASTVTKQLLFSSGKTFADRLLFTQAEAMNYAAHLAQVLHKQEDNLDRQQFLATLAHRCTTLHDQVVELLK